MVSVFLESDFLHFTWEFPRVGKLQLLNHTDAMVVAVCCQDVTLSVCGNRSTCTCTDTVIRGITEIVCVLRHQFLPLQDYKNTKRVRVRVRIVHVYVRVHYRG